MSSTHGTGASCRHCGTTLERSFCDLGVSPLANSYLTASDLRRGEMFYPLHAYVCDHCLLVQLDEFEPPEEIFSDYAYFSSVSSSWLAHAKAYTDEVIDRFEISPEFKVVELASNDGYLLQYFAQRGIDVLGVEPAANVAQAALDRGIPTEVGFFGTRLAAELTGRGIRADLLIGNNVLAHVPALNDFVAGMKLLLAPDGFVTMEFPHLLELIRGNQFDTIYHEHFSYFSFLTASRVFATHGLRMFDVKRIPTHGGSLRVFACHDDSTRHPETRHVSQLLDAEAAAGLHAFDGHEGFQERVSATKRELLGFLIDARGSGTTVVGYGAPAKGNTLLNYCGIGPDLLRYTVDLSPHKQGHFLPGSRIPIFAPDHIASTRPDVVLILPWNLRDEIAADLGFIAEWGGRLAVPVPRLEVFSP